MSDYIGRFESSGILVSDIDKFIKLLEQLGFESDDKEFKVQEDRLYAIFTHGDKKYISIMGYNSIPRFLYECNNNENCSSCEAREWLEQTLEGDDLFCPLKESEKETFTGDSDFDLEYIIKHYMEPGTKVMLFEIGHTKLRHVTAYEAIITKDSVECKSLGVEFGDVLS